MHFKILSLVILVSSQVLARSRSPSIQQIVAGYGYHVEPHDVATPDGYILTVHRVSQPCARNATRHFTPILMGHGLMADSEQWLLRPDQNLAFLLVNHGFDVWLGNFRGTNYGRRHKRLSTKSHKFWDFSWHENGFTDQAAMIDYVLEATGRQRLLTLSFSMSCTTSMVLLSERPEYNDKTIANVFAAPAGYFRHPAGLWKLTKSILDLFPDLIKHATGRYIVNDKMPFSDLPLEKICFAAKSNNALTPICKALTEFFAGKPNSPLEYPMLRLFSSRFPSGASIRQITHYSQSIQSAGEFRRYDFGVRKNRQLYGSPVPPSYNLSAISSPIYFYYGLSDSSVSFKDATNLVKRLRSTISVHEVPGFNHFDFIMDKTAEEAFNKKVLQNLLNHASVLPDLQTNNNVTKV